MKKILSYWHTELKERYSIGKNKTCLRSQIYIKLTRSNDNDSRKHPLKFVCMKYIIFDEKVNKNNFPVSVYLAVLKRFIHFSF